MKPCRPVRHLASRCRPTKPCAPPIGLHHCHPCQHLALSEVAIVISCMYDQVGISPAARGLSVQAHHLLRRYWHQWLSITATSVHQRCRRVHTPGLRPLVSFDIRPFVPSLPVLSPFLVAPHRRYEHRTFEGGKGGRTKGKKKREPSPGLVFELLQVLCSHRHDAGNSAALGPALRIPCPCPCPSPRAAASRPAPQPLQQPLRCRQLAGVGQDVGGEGGGGAPDHLDALQGKFKVKGVREGLKPGAGCGRAPDHLVALQGSQKGRRTQAVKHTHMSMYRY